MILQSMWTGTVLIWLRLRTDWWLRVYLRDPMPSLLSIGLASTLKLRTVAHLIQSILRCNWSSCSEVWERIIRIPIISCMFICLRACVVIFEKLDCCYANVNMYLNIFSFYLKRNTKLICKMARTKKKIFS